MMDARQQAGAETPGKAHLSDEQFAEVMLGGPVSADAQAHLAECGACHAEVEGFLTPVYELAQASLEWSRGTQPTRLSDRVKARRWGTAPLGWAMAAALVAGIGLPVLRHHEQQMKQQADLREGAPMVAGDDSAEQIAADNRLLEQVNVALEEDDPSPMEEYGLSQAAARRGKAHAAVWRAE